MLLYDLIFVLNFMKILQTLIRKLHASLQEKYVVFNNAVNCRDYLESVADKLGDTDTISFYFWTCPSSTFKKKKAFRKWALLPSLGKETPNLVDTLHRAILSH
jgi:hypothetical protein